MRTAAAAFSAGAAVTAAALFGLLRVLARPPHLRENYRGRPVVGTAGLALTLPLACGLAAAAHAPPAGWRAAVGAAGAAWAMGLLGLADDLWGDPSARGFRGHLRALAAGRVTTGLLKAVGGLAAGLGAVRASGGGGWRLWAGGAAVALGANLFNLLDLRPGRAAKAWLAAWGALWLASPPAAPAILSSALAGGVAAFLPFDLRERAMLGDSGSNLIGAALAAVAVTSLGDGGLLALLATLGALTAASEVVSFGRIIDALPPLRALDRLGRRP